MYDRSIWKGIAILRLEAKSGVEKKPCFNYIGHNVTIISEKNNKSMLQAEGSHFANKLL